MRRGPVEFPVVLVEGRPPKNPKAWALFVRGCWTLAAFFGRLRLSRLEDELNE